MLWDGRSTTTDPSFTKFRLFCVGGFFPRRSVGGALGLLCTKQFIQVGGESDTGISPAFLTGFLRLTGTGALAHSSLLMSLCAELMC